MRKSENQKFWEELGDKPKGRYKNCNIDFGNIINMVKELTCMIYNNKKSRKQINNRSVKEVFIEMFDIEEEESTER